ncbi:MAG: PIN domain-containing protein [Algoriphagus aquaeductus]|uniref:PIN domain-containing protein n=1 Tax=Algoriphagus aquaeductus TaxID=475299 RepID=UPI00391B54B4
MKYLLDTNICVHFLRGNFKLINKFRQIGIENCAISEMTFAELVFGAENNSNPEKNLELIEAFTSQLIILPIIQYDSLLCKRKSAFKIKRQNDQ